jgi:tetratricopeptide (TPR) repeat protein
MENKWSPAKINDVAIDKKYTVIFRYRSYLNTEPTEYKSGIASYVKKQKYDKAIKLYDEQISENQYDFELFTERAKLKELVGDKAGAIQDNKIADKLNVEIMSVVNLIMVGVTRVVRTVGNPERVIR